jgi:CubicO group peptidase (beta-lactamase class C family)
VPRDLGPLTTVGPEERDLAAVGMSADGREAIWRAVEALYRTGTHPAIALCVRRRGRVVIDRALGHAHGRSPQSSGGATLATPETPFCLFSASKAHTAVLVHLLAERGFISLDDRVADHLPAFGRHGKDRVTVRQLLTHRAGIPTVPGALDDPSLLLEPERALAAVCDARPSGPPGGAPAYHALSTGYVVAALAEQATGRDLRALMRDEILAPAGFSLCNYGIAAERVNEVATNVVTGLPLPRPVAALTTRALGVTWAQATQLSSDPRFFAHIIPSANIIATANEASRFYQLLLGGGVLDGVRIFPSAPLAAARRVTSRWRIDRILLVPVRHGEGLMLGAPHLSPYGPGTPEAFGHVGFMPLICWADPQRDIAAALLTSGKLLADTHLIGTLGVLRAIARACPPMADRQRGRAGSARRG